jgi:hypothetical protein
MKPLSWKPLVELVGIAAIVASLVFVGYQLQQDRRLAAAQVIVAADAVTLELSSLIGENREVWLNGLNGEELSDVEEVMFQIVAEAHFRKHLGVFQRVQLLGFGTAESVAAAYAFDLYRYPQLRQLYVQRRQQSRSIYSYVDASSVAGLLISFGARVDEKLLEFDSKKPDNIEDSLFPF